ncbi:Bacterial Ig domain protein [Caballeronia sp. SBC1]|uniref:Ig-like domain-containing protein n=1 Tax=Caballeronia sp. SBC1 TaxID=2705548 RepID=UPI00140A9913|nr:Ig-like domain-containing protein [Caballeronia sp. SBC1]QIN60592.1 Bacterial Ig domain protein [Caballeronia sp. SBC1]
MAIQPTPPNPLLAAALKTPIVTSLVDGNSLPIVDGVTADASPKMSGTGTAGDIISLYDGVILLGSTIIDANGKWSVQPAVPMAPGSHGLFVVESNAAGDTSLPSDRSWIIVTPSYAPAPVITSLVNEAGPAQHVIPNNGFTNDSHPTISGTGVAGSSILVYVDGVNSYSPVIVDATGHWTFTLAVMGDGPHVLSAGQYSATQDLSPQSNTWTVTVDTSPVAKPVVNVPTDDSGVPITGTTTDAHPNISGTGKAGDTITVYDGSKVIGSVVIGADGKWSFKPTTDLSNGTHDIYVIETNPAGTSSPQSDHTAIVINTNPSPVILNIVDAVGPVQGTVPVGGVTDDTHPTISGTGIPGNTVYVYQNGIGCGDTKVAADGTWSIKITGAMSNGVHDMTATQFAAGQPQSPASNHWSFTIDTSTPAKPVVNPLTDDSGKVISGPTTDGHPNISGTGKAGDTITVYDGSKVIGSVVIGADGKWSIKPTTDLSVGTHDIYAIETNLAGTSSPQSDHTALTVTTGIAPPAASINWLNGQSLDAHIAPGAGSNRLDGLGEPGDVVTLYNGSKVLGSAAVGADGLWGLFITGLAGSSDIYVTQTNAAGVVSPPSSHFNFALSADKPVVTSITNEAGVPITNGVTNDARPIMNGTGKAGDTIVMYSADSQPVGSTIVKADGTWSVKPTVDLSGKLDLYVVESNPGIMSDTASAHTSMVIDTSTPAKPVVNPLTDDSGVPITGSTTDAHPNISGTGKAGDTITVYDGSKVIGSVVIGADGKWSIKPTTDLSVGTHDIYAIETNLAGTPSAQSDHTALTVTTGIAPPAASINWLNGQSIDVHIAPTAGTNRLDGLGEPGDVVTLYNGSKVLGSAAVNAAGVWSIFTTGLAGSSDVYVTQTNAAGVVSQPSSHLNFALSADKPVVTSITNEAGVPITNGVTNDARPIMNGTGKAGDTIVMYSADSQAVGSTIVKADGTWSVKPTVDLSGKLDLYVVESNPGIMSNTASAHTSMVIDTSTPAKPVVNVPTDDSGVPITGSTTDAHPTFSGTGKAGDTITMYDGSKVIGSVVIGADGKWSIKPTTDLSSGTHDIYVIETNPAGTSSPQSDHTSVVINTNPSPVILNVVDAVGPIQGTVPAGGVTDDTHPTISGTGIPGNTVYVYQNGIGCGDTKVGADGKWSIKIPGALSNGVHDMTATQFAANQPQSPVSNHWSITVDTSTPAKPVVNAPTDDSGKPISGTTTDAHPTFSGTGKAGDTITMYDGKTAIGSVVIGADGKWSLKPTTDLSSGTHDIYVIETNPAGTSSPQSDHTSVVINTNPSPVILNVVDAVGPVQGTVPAGGVTDDTHPTISGTGIPGDTVYLYQNGIGCGDTKVGADGKWSIKLLGALSTGAHDFTATQFVPGQPESPVSNHWSITVDTSTPAKPVVNAPTDDSGKPISGTTTDAHPTFSGTGKAGDTITMYDGKTAIGSVVIGADGKWSLKPTTDLSSGTHDIYVIETNPAGTSSPQSDHTSVVINTNPSPVILNVVDAVGPVQGTVPAGGVTDDTHPTISGTGIPGDTVYLYQNGIGCGDTKVGADGKWSIKLLGALSTGAHDFTATQFVPGQPESPVSNHWSITVDTSTPAKPVVNAPTDDSGKPISGTTTDAHPTFSGTGKAGDTITMYDGKTAIGSVVIGADGKWSLKPTTDLSSGTHDIYVIETNPAGTSSPQSDHTSVVINTNPSPVILNVVDAVGSVQGTVPAGGVTDDPRPTISGTGIPGDTVYVYQNGMGCGDTKVGADGKWSIKLLSDLSTGAHDFTATQFAAGQPESPASNHWSITVDTSTPAKPVITGLTDDAGAAIPAGGATVNAHPTVSGTAKAGDIVTLYDGSTVIGSAKAGTDGKWSIKPSTDLSAGSHDVYAIDTNLAGTPSAQSTHVAFTVVSAFGPPVITNVVDATSTHAGTVPTGGTTTDTHPTVSGTGIPGDIIYLYQNGSGCGGTTVGANGTWSVKIPGDLSAGWHAFTATQFAPGQSESVASNSWYVSVAASSSSGGTSGGSGPSSVTITKIVDSNNNAMSNVAASKELHPTVSGTAPAGSTIQVVAGMTWVGRTTADANGNWSVTVTGDITNSATKINGMLLVSFTAGLIGAGGNDYDYSAVVTALINPNLQSVMLKSTHVVVDDSVVVATDTHDQQAVQQVAQPAAPVAEHHTVVDATHTFKGTAGGNETVDLSVDPASYFKQATAHIEGAKGGAVDTLHLMGDHQVLDLTSLTGKTAAAKISGIEAIDLGGQHNTLKLSLTDVLNLGETDLFQKDGKQQMMVNGKDGDSVDLSNSHVAGLADGEWAQHGTAQVGGVTYNVYEHSGAHTELLVQQGVQIVVH